MRIWVISTGKNAPTKERCLESVRSQKSRALAEHIYVEAGAQDPPRPVTDNLQVALGRAWGITDRDVLVWLDGDDWLADAHVVGRVAQIYESDPETWLTYGSFRYADGRPGFCRPYEHAYFEGEAWYYRREDWRGTHLKTFRVGLFRKVRPEDLTFELAVDQAVMLPMLEMAGAAHARFVPDVLCIYNYASSYAHRAGPKELADEARAVTAIRKRTPYERLASL